MSTVFAALGLNYLSWMTLCLGLPRHYQRHFSRPPSAAVARNLRIAGWLLALIACACSVWSSGWGIGSVYFTATWMLAALIWIVLQAFVPRVARALAVLAVAGVVGCFFHAGLNGLA